MFTENNIQTHFKPIKYINFRILTFFQIFEFFTKNMQKVSLSKIYQNFTSEAVALHAGLKNTCSFDLETPGNMQQTYTR